MHKAVPVFTIQHYISHTLLINFNYWSVSRKQPRPLLQDQDQDRIISVSSGLETKTAVSRTTRLDWWSTFQTEAAATTKARSPIEEHRVAGMSSKDDAAERRCFWPGTSAMCRTSDDNYPAAVLLTHWNILVDSFEVIRSVTRSQWSWRKSGVKCARVCRRWISDGKLQKFAV